MNIFYECKRKQPRDIWDYQFCINTQIKNGYTLVPAKNLIRNIGNDVRATHTSGIEDDVPVQAVMPLSYSQRLIYDNKLDVLLAKKRMSKLRTAYNFIRNILR